MKKAFSLIELMIVIIILGLLGTLVLPNLLGKGEEAKRNLVCSQMRGVSEALKMFKIDNGMYPTTSEGLKALVSNPDSTKYVGYAPNAYLESKKPPKDSWKTPIIYVSDEENGYNLISLGADRKEGGTKGAKDISFNSDCKD
jgi:general secretion pathway protein G